MVTGQFSPGHFLNYISSYNDQLVNLRFVLVLVRLGPGS